MNSIAPSENAVRLVELNPVGVVPGQGTARPMLVLKGSAESEVLPVWVSPLEAGLILSLGSIVGGAIPHNVTDKLMNLMGVKLTRCEFVEVVGHHVFVNLTFEGQNQVFKIKSRADEAMSLCLKMKARFFASQDIMERCRRAHADLNESKVEIVTRPQIEKNKSLYYN